MNRKNSCHQSHNSCQLKNKAEKPAIIKQETKRAKKESEKRERKKRDALRKRFVNLEQEGDANGLKARGIQKIILVNLAGGAAIAIGDVVHKDHE